MKKESSRLMCIGVRLALVTMSDTPGKYRIEREGEEGRMESVRVLPILAYTAGPYRDRRGEWYVLQNINRARQVALELWKAGIPAICPHANTSHFGGTAPDDLWLEGDLVMLQRCDLLVTVPGWTNSAGSIEEVKTAKEHGIPTFHAEWNGAMNRFDLPAELVHWLDRKFPV